MKDQLGLIDRADETAALAQAVKDNGGVYLVPHFPDLSAPYWKADARAAIVGMTAFTRKEHIVRAALESIAYQIRDVLEMMQAEGGIAPQLLFADGGPTRNEFLMQFTADILDWNWSWPRCRIVGAGRGDGGHVGIGNGRFIRRIVRLAARVTQLSPTKIGRRSRQVLCRMADGSGTGVLRKTWRTTASLPNIWSKRPCHWRRRPSRWPASNRQARSRACRAKRMNCASGLPRKSNPLSNWSRCQHHRFRVRRNRSRRRRLSARAGADQFSAGEHGTEPADDYFDGRRKSVRASTSVGLAAVGSGISRLTYQGIFWPTVWHHGNSPTNWRLRSPDHWHHRQAERRPDAARNRRFGPTLAEAGVDFVKDDELMANPPHSPFVERVKAVMHVVNDQATKTGKKLMYAFNISDQLDQMLKHHDTVVAAGGTCVMVSLNSVGYAAVDYLRRHCSLPIHGHRNGWGMFSRHPALGMEFTAYQKLWRLIGIDQLHVNGLKNKFCESDESVVRSINACLTPMFGGYSVMPVVSSGQWGGQAPETFRQTQTLDVMYLAGGGILAHPGGPAAGVTAIRQAWEAAAAGVALEEFAKQHAELRQSLEFFGQFGHSK